VQEDLELAVKEILVELETLHLAQRVAVAVLVLLDLAQVVV
jgi:hypothetical protein